MPDRLAYLEFINQLFRRSGFDVPIITCNWLTDPPVPGTIECINSWSDVVSQLKRLRMRQFEAPLLVTEFWSGWFDKWGDKHETRDAKEAARRSMEILGCGGQYNHYMWHGGTNFGFFGSGLLSGKGDYQTTSYDYDAPLAEGGGLTEKYYLPRHVNLLAQHMGPYLGQAGMDQPGVSATNVPEVLNIVGLDGSWAVVTNNGRDDITTAGISIPTTGQQLTVPLEPFGAMALPYELVLSPGHTLDWANLSPLGFFGGRTLVFHGPKGFEGRISINGKELAKPIPAGDEPSLFSLEGLTIALIASDLAMRTWYVDDVLVFGPAWVGEDLSDMVPPSAAAKQFNLLLPDGKLSRRKYRSGPARKPTAPKLTLPKRYAVCAETSANSLSWKKIDRPKDLDRLGVHYGYGWYNIEIDAPRAKKRNLFLPDCEDRASLFLNGEKIGIWGRGPGAVRTALPARFKRGKNTLSVLADNLGRANFGPNLGSAKGLFGHIFDAKPMKMRRFKLSKAESFTKRIVPRSLSHLLVELERADCWIAETDITLATVTPLSLEFSDLPCHLSVSCNDRSAGFFQAIGKNRGEVNLSGELKKGKNRIRLVMWGDVTAKHLENFTCTALNENLSAEAKWLFRPWEVPQVPQEHLPKAVKNIPGWYSTKFAYTPKPSPMPLFVSLSGLKGQIFLNGHNVGRYWKVGPQKWYYLPECWLKEKNELLIFDEAGQSPAPAKLAYMPKGPYAQ